MLLGFPIYLLLFLFNLTVAGALSDFVYSFIIFSQIFNF